jgi:hypothetical protein
MFKPEIKKPFKISSERLYCIVVGVEGLQIPLTRRAVDESTSSLRSGGPFFIFVLI